MPVPNLGAEHGFKSLLGVVGQEEGAAVSPDVGSQVFEELGTELVRGCLVQGPDQRTRPFRGRRGGIHSSGSVEQTRRTVGPATTIADMTRLGSRCRSNAIAHSQKQVAITTVVAYGSALTRAQPSLSADTEGAAT